MGQRDTFWVLIQSDRHLTVEERKGLEDELKDHDGLVVANLENDSAVIAVLMHGANRDKVAGQANEIVMRLCRSISIYGQCNRVVD